MFEVGVIEQLFGQCGIPYRPAQLAKKLDKINNRDSLTPVEKLQNLIEDLDLKQISIQQAAVSQAGEQCFPGLIYLKQSWHFIQCTPEGYLLSSQSLGKKTVKTLDRLPTTVIVWLERPELSYAKSGEERITRVSGLIKRVALRHKRWVLDLTIATLMVNLFAIVTSLFAMQVYDRVVPSLALDTLFSLVIGVVIIYLIDFALKVTRARVLDTKSSRIDAVLSHEVFSHLMKTRLDALPSQLGTLTAQISGIESVRQFFTSSILFALVDLPFALLFLAIIYLIGGPIAYVYAAFFVASIIIGWIAQLRSQALNRQVTLRSHERQGVLVDAIKGAETVKSTGASAMFQNEWDAVNRSISSFSLKQKSISSFTTSLSALLGSLAYASAIVIGVHLIAEGEITMGTMIACSILGGRVLGPVGQAVNYMIQFNNVKQSTELVNQFLELPEERQRSESLVFPVTRPQDISVKGVRFAYPGSQLAQVSIEEFSAKAGERIAILGSIGSGKSTLLKLLAGLYKPQTGLIKTGGADLWTLDPFYMTKNISYLPQTPDLFKGTLKSNLTLGRNVSDTKLLHTIELLNITSIMEQNDKGLDLPISEGGSGLSGGQRQLVGLARLFLNGPSIWILDEPTAALDQSRQATVRKALQAVLQPSDILIFATHNPALAVEMANRVLVMERGQIVKDVPASSVTWRHSNG